MSEQSREHVRASRHSGNIQETLCENARSARKYPITKRIVAYQQGAHVQGDVQRDSERELEKRRGRATPESRPGNRIGAMGENRSGAICRQRNASCIQDGWVGLRQIVLKTPMSAKAFYNGYLS